MTSKPSASSSTRAVARKDGWSSTIRTRAVHVLIDCRRTERALTYGWPYHVPRPSRVIAVAMRLDRGAGSGAPNTAVPATNTVAPAAAHGAAVRGVDRRRRPRAPAPAPSSARRRSSLASELCEERLAAPARVDGHAQHDVDVVDELGRRRRPACPG